jgi:hypothetical protein
MILFIIICSLTILQLISNRFLFHVVKLKKNYLAGVGRPTKAKLKKVKKSTSVSLACGAKTFLIIVSVFVRQDENFFQTAESLNTLLISFELQSQNVM